VEVACSGAYQWLAGINSCLGGVIFWCVFRVGGDQHRYGGDLRDLDRTLQHLGRLIMDFVVIGVFGSGINSAVSNNVLVNCCCK